MSRGLGFGSVTALARGEILNGLNLLNDAAKQQAEKFDDEDDPSPWPNVLYNTLGRVYLAQKASCSRSLRLRKR